MVVIDVHAYVSRIHQEANHLVHFGRSRDTNIRYDMFYLIHLFTNVNSVLSNDFIC